MQSKQWFNWVRFLTLNRVLNFILLVIGYLLSRLFKTPIQLGMPAYVSIEPTTACNLGCPECPSGLKKFTRPTGKMDLALHENWLDQLAKTALYITYYFQGEPFLHPQFLGLIRAAKKRKLYTASSTNAHFITEKLAEEIVVSGLDQLIISVDGVSQEVYQQYRVNGSLSKVWEGTINLVKAKQKFNSKVPNLIFQCLAVKPNEHEIPLIFDKAKEFGVDEVRIKTAQLYDFEHGNPLLPVNEDYSRYQRNNEGIYKLKNPGGNHCWRMWSGTVITWDGKVVPCCFDKDATHRMGELMNETFDHIWKNKSYQRFRKTILTQRNKIEICRNCSEGSNFWI